MANSGVKQHSSENCARAASMPSRAWTKWAAALFGAVFAGAVILSEDRPVRGLNDSKLLEPERREVLAERIRERAVAWAVAAVDAAMIDRINIYQASRMAMRMAVSRLNPAPDFLLVDAVPLELAVAAARAHQGRCAMPRDCGGIDSGQSGTRRLHARVGPDLPRVRTGVAQGLFHAGALSRPGTIRAHSAAPPEF